MDRTGQLRTILLKERVPRECRLAPADVDFLMAEHRAHVELAPAGQRGRYRITPAGHVGTLFGPSCRLVIRPKLPIKNLFYLLDAANPVATVEDYTAAVPGTEVLDFLAGRLAQLLKERAAAGLHRGYAERADLQPFLQGRLDLPAQLRGQAERRDQFHCQYEEFTADVPCNQVPKATAELVLRSPLVCERVRTVLRQTLRAFAGVSVVPLDADRFAAAVPDRLTEAYQPLLDLCRLLADGLTAGSAAGQTSCPAFLLDMERVFERYVTQGIVRAFPPGDVAVQPLFAANQSVAGQPDILMRPDILIRRAGRPIVVVDAKWKVLRRSPLMTDDLYQMLAYCTALGVRQAVLVYPGRRNRAWEYPLEHAPVYLTIRTLQVVGSQDACQKSLQRLARTLRRGISGGAV